MTIHTTPEAPHFQVLGKPGDIYMDGDGVTVDWLSPFAQFAFEAYGIEVDPAGPDDFDLTSWLGLDHRDQTAKIVMEFNAGAGGHFSRLPALPGAKKALSILKNSGRDLHMITSSSRKPHIIDQRHQNMRLHFGDVFSSITCLDPHESKEPYLARLAPSVWIEDNYHNALHGAKHGHRTFIIRSPHNRKFETPDLRSPLTWVDGWYDILTHLEL